MDHAGRPHNALTPAAGLNNGGPPGPAGAFVRFAAGCAGPRCPGQAPTVGRANTSIVRATDDPFRDSERFVGNRWATWCPAQSAGWSGGGSHPPLTLSNGPAAHGSCMTGGRTAHNVRA